MLERKKLRFFAERQRPRFEELLRAFVQVPTVSADPARKKDIARGVDLAVATIESFGGKAFVHAAPRGNPVVRGEFVQGRNLPTVTVYNHLDVQPARPETEPWRTDPFLLTKRGNKYFGRGTTDDKGPALTALFGVHAAREENVAVNSRVLWEFEEEIGSPHFEAFLVDAESKLQSDAVVVSDTVWLSKSIPACPSGLRGFQGFVFSLETAKGDRHSGDVGGAARNPLGELMSLVAQIHDPKTGRVKVPDFYRDVLPLTRKERSEFKRSGFSLRRFKNDHELLHLRTGDSLDVMKRIWALPTFEVHGVAGGHGGPGLKAVVPGRAEVRASCRLVPNQKPEQIFRLIRSFVKTRNSDVQVRSLAPSAPFRGVTSGPLAEEIRDAMAFGFGRKPVFIRDGGTIGAVLSLEKVLRCPVVFLGISLPEDGYHAPNESFDWRQASGGVAAFAKYFENVARRHHR
jgi:acetylornithine deacetylase/succinyl-diaminopimelate desuccinylase-like protein